MKSEICVECQGTGVWFTDDHGNQYKHPIKCDECGGSGARIRLDNGKLQPLNSW